MRRTRELGNAMGSHKEEWGWPRRACPPADTVSVRELPESCLQVLLCEQGALDMCGAGVAHEYVTALVQLCRMQPMLMGTAGSPACLGKRRL